MNNGDSFANILIALGFIMIVLGLVWLMGSKLGLSPFHLPGDIVVKRDNYTFYFPWVTCIVVSIIISIIFYIMGRR